MTGEPVRAGACGATAIHMRKTSFGTDAKAVLKALNKTDGQGADNRHYAGVGQL